MDNDVFVYDEENNKIKINVLYTYNSEETHKDYIIYNDGSLDVSAKLNTFVARYIPGEAISKLYFDIDERDLMYMHKVFNGGIK